MKTICIGLDGACLELITPWVEKNELPNIRKLIENGVYGDLKSCVPPVTCPNWKCYSTGMNPGKIGLYWWERINVKNGTIELPSYNCTDIKEIWDYLNDAKLKVAVINMPMSYPPKKVNGFFLSGGPSSESINYFWPPSLKKELEQLNYRVHPSVYLNHENKMEYVDEICNMFDSRFNLAIKLMTKNDIDFIHITLFYINALQHHFWNDDEVLRAWKNIDYNIGKIMNVLSSLDESVNIIIMSDHGSNRIKNVFYINSWLKNKRYLFTLDSTSDLLIRLGVTSENMMTLIRKLGIDVNTLRRIIPKFVRWNIPSRKGVNMIAKGKKINWEKTKVIASSQGPIYITLPKNSKLYNKTASRLKQELSSILDPKTKEPIFSHVYMKDDVYWGDRLENAPDIIVVASKGYHISGVIGTQDTLVKPNNWKAENKLEGIFIASGPTIKKGYNIANISILDLAPTILALHGVTVSKQMDGQILNEIFQKEYSQ